MDTPFFEYVLPLSVTAAMVAPGACCDCGDIVNHLSYFKSTSSLPKYFQSTSDIFEVTWKYDVRTYVIIAKKMQVTCFAGTRMLL